MNRVACYTASAACSMFVCASGSVEAQVSLRNGGFESVGQLYDPALGGLYRADDWINLSNYPIQASSAPVGVEGTNPLFMGGSRYLRLASDTGDFYQGAIAQNLGIQNAGETYTFTADLFGGDDFGGRIIPFRPTAMFANQPSITPSLQYISQTAQPLTGGATALQGFQFSYTATASDQGMPLYVILFANPSGTGVGVRGGVDNTTLTVSSAVPEPGTIALFVGMTSVGVTLRRRKNRQSAVESRQ